MGECADGEIALSRQPVGQETQHHTLSCAWIPTDKGETTLAHQTILDAPAEAVNPAGLQQRLRGQFGREWIELEAVETEQLLVHDEGSSSSGSSGKYGGGRPVAANSAISLLSRGATSSRGCGAVVTEVFLRRRSPEAFAFLSTG